MLYDALVALHVVAAVVGFGAVALSGVYGSMARHVEQRQAGEEGIEEAVRYFRSPGRAEWLVLAVPFVGIAALAARPRGGDFGAVWVVTSALVWLAAAALLVGVVRPSERQIRARAGAGAGAALAGRRLMWAGVASDLLFLVALVLMVSQPA